MHCQKLTQRIINVADRKDFNVSEAHNKLSIDFVIAF